MLFVCADRLLQRLQKELEVAQEIFRADVRATARREREQVILNAYRTMHTFCGETHTKWWYLLLP